MERIRSYQFARAHEWIFLSAIVIVGTILRIIAQAHVVVISPDGVQYIKYALSVSEGVGNFERRGPLFQLLLIIIYKISRVNLQSSVFFPLFFGSILPIIFFFVGKHFFDSKTGLMAALLSSVNPKSIYYSCWVLRETFSLFLILIFILTSHYTLKIRPKRNSLVATIIPAFLCGLIILTREEMIFVIVLAYVTYIFFNEKKHRDFLSRMLIFITVTILIISPWLLYSSIHFGNPFYSYLWYMKGTFARARDIALASAGKGNTSFVLHIASLVLTFVYGIWKQINTLPHTYSLIGMVFLGIGIMYTVKKRAIWIIYFITAYDIFILSYVFGRDLIRDIWTAPHTSNNVSRIPYSAIFPLIIISAYGIRRFISFLLHIDQKKVIPPTSNRTKVKLSVLVFSGLLIFGSIEFVSIYSLMLKYFDERSSFPFKESAEFLNSIESEDGVFTMHPEMLAKYYNGSIYKLPEKGDFEHLLEEALMKGVRYLIIESTCVSSRELIKLFRHSVDESWELIPQGFVLLKTEKWDYGLYYLDPARETQAWFKAAIFSTSKWDASTRWERILTTGGASTRNFDETSSLLDIALSEFDLVVFADFSRPLKDTERLYLEESIEKGLTVVVSGLSPPYLAGGTSDLTSISTWFGATVFSEAPKEERWKVKFTDSAIEIMKLDLEHEYALYTNLEWSTPTGCVVQPEAVVYAYRVNDGAGTIFLQKFGKGMSIFIGPRYGFSSTDKDTFEAFLQSLIRSVLAGTT